ncbi:MAG: hypothetical protein JXA68_03830 [Ignavibacteriales bacterium]|nr:hypothetical protein [Ignavibacteriales bacterium]
MSINLIITFSLLCVFTVVHFLHISRYTGENENFKMLLKVYVGGSVAFMFIYLVVLLTAAKWYHPFILLGFGIGSIAVFLLFAALLKLKERLTFFSGLGFFIVPAAVIYMITLFP